MSCIKAASTAADQAVESAARRPSAASRLPTVRATESKARRQAAGRHRQSEDDPLAVQNVCRRRRNLPQSGVPGARWNDGRCGPNGRRRGRSGHQRAEIGFVPGDTADQGRHPVRIRNRGGQHGVQPAQRRRHQRRRGGKPQRRLDRTPQRRPIGGADQTARVVDEMPQPAPPLPSPVTETRLWGDTGAIRTCSTT